MRAVPSATRGPAVAIVVCVLLGASGCSLSTRKQAASQLTVTGRAGHSALVAVVSGATPAAFLAKLVARTARPGEDVNVLALGGPDAVLAAASSPPPAKVIVPGRPAAPGAGATPFQQAQYRRNLSRWRDEVTGATKAVAARTHAALAAWASGLGIRGKVSRYRQAPHPPGRLASECAIAASALVGLSEAGGSFGGQRVVLLFAQHLGGRLPSGELTGDDVIVVTSFLPAGAALSAAQERLLAAGAARAGIVGPETTAAQLAHLVSLGLSQKVVSETLSGAALFANNSARLGPRAARVLMPLVAPLREAGAAAVINGYASTPGSRARNYLLSYARAAAVAAFLEARGIPASSLDIVGHGASGLAAPGPAAANRRVVVTVEEPAVA
jgi:outer membrane protein OmpA-like peptidoglycan-associated protein